MKCLTLLLSVLLFFAITVPASGGFFPKLKRQCRGGQCSLIPAVVAASPDQAKLKRETPAPKPDQSKMKKHDQVKPDQRKPK